MTVAQRERARKLQDRLCTMTVECKGVRERACETCDSPCRYGGELLTLLGKPKPQARAEDGLYAAPVPGRARSVQRLFRAVNKRRVR